MSRLRPLVDRILNGSLDQEITERRQAGQSYNDIARWLGDAHGVTVSDETVRLWHASIVHAEGDAA